MENSRPIVGDMEEQPANEITIWLETLVLSHTNVDALQPALQPLTIDSQLTQFPFSGRSPSHMV
jgi:hypothetical protein